MAALLASVTLLAQGRLDPARLLKPATDSWPTFNGDYSGRRFSALTTIDPDNVHQLSLAWAHRIGSGGTPLGAIKSTPLQINGVIYFTVPDHVWAVDARTGRELWHYQWQTTGGNHLANRGVAVYQDWLYVETPDCYLVSLTLRDGKERWRRQICDMDRFYYASAAPVVVKNHLISASPEDYPKEALKYKEQLKGRSMLGVKTEKFPIECVVRGYRSGSSQGDRPHDGPPVTVDRHDRVFNSSQT